VKFTLQPYQHDAVERVRLAFMAGHRSVLFVLPTGGGKTVVFSHIAQQAAARGNRIAGWCTGSSCWSRPPALWRHWASSTA
jgi:superfamily II DNA or RNA helicase